MFENTTPDARIYATVFYSDHSLQYTATVIVNILATPMSLLTFYLILKHSKFERFSYKLCLFASHFSFYISQLQLGAIGGMVLLHPFPAVYWQGILQNYFDAFTMFMIWFLTFCSYGYFALLVLLIRLQIVARPGKFRKQSYYVLVYAILAIFVYVPVPGLMLLSYSPPQEMADFVRKKFPNNLQVLKNPGVYIFTGLANTDLASFVKVITVVLGFTFIITIHICIYRETRVKSTNTSNKRIKEHLKKLYNMLIQTTMIAAFMTISILLIFKSFFNDPSVDSRLSNTIAYSCLCGSSIPNQIMIISRNTAYKNFVLRRKKRHVNSSSTLQQHRSTILKI